MLGRCTLVVRKVVVVQVLSSEALAWLSVCSEALVWFAFRPADAVTSPSTVASLTSEVII